jgi:hypothetical protein
LDILSRHNILLGQLLPFSMAATPRLSGMVCVVLRNFRLFAAFRVWFSLKISFGASLFNQFKKGDTWRGGSRVEVVFHIFQILKII